jgi:peptidoglycan/LPS O-acetylase OafA/YrhL
MRGTCQSYRPDIDGLRAVAVLSVVLYHAGVPMLPGGFVGVDIFFVISGFLITRIIAREIADDRFSIVRFYERRTRRIFPALFVMLGVSSIVSIVVLLPAEMLDFGHSLAAATLFVSNVFFWQTADYFGGPAHLKPLLHTWSLAVEEQFYIILPLLLLVLARLSRQRTMHVLLALTALSFLVSVWAVVEKPNAAFYLLPTRFWELMAGALLALGALPAVASRRVASFTAGMGVGLVAISIFGFSSATAFPGTHALAPVLGTVLIIHAGTVTREIGVTRALSLPPVVFVGVVSYSFYLWHWPVLTFTRIWRGEILEPGATALLVAVSFVLAVLSWRFVETPFRERRVAAAPRPLFGAAALAMTVTLAFGVFAHVSQGWTQRHDGYAPPLIAGLEQMNLGVCFLTDTQQPDAWAGAEPCRHGPAGAPLVLVWGDSFAAHLMPGLMDEAARQFQFVQMTAGGCPPLPDIDNPNRPHCRAFNARVLAEIARVRPDVVVVSARWDLYMPRVATSEQINAMLQRVSAVGSRVIAVGPSPTFDFANPYDFVYRSGRASARANDRPAFNAERSVSVFDPAPLFCTGDHCDLVGETGFLFFDGGHFSVEGSRRVARRLIPKIDEVLAGRFEIETSAANH